ncbi:MAG: META domain-containing protein [Bacteroidetes bacterium]|nr:META domain-containing protein [Bacteroidota bacterium]
MKVYTAILAGLILFSVSCKKQDAYNPVPSCFTPNEIDTVQHSLFATWELIGFVNPDGAEACKPERAGYCSLVIDGSPQSKLHGGCNEGFTEYLSITPDSIRFGKVTRTLVYCDNKMDVEDRFFKGIQQSALYSIRNDILTISTKDGDILKFRFRP